MEHWIHSPPLLQRKVLFTLFLGIGSISIAGVMFFLSKDYTLLILSIFILIGCIIRSITLFLIIAQTKYDTVTGTCTGILAVPFRRYRKVFLVNDAGDETTLLLGKDCLIKPGTAYRFYFKLSGTVPTGNDYLDAMLSTNGFLGYEEWYPEVSDENAPEQ